MKNLRGEWRLWVGLAGMSAVGVAFMIFGGTLGLIIGGWMLGLITGLALFGWMIGFDVYALPWLWGSWGEEQTGEELEKLGADWFVVHDIENGFGNWDHVVVGPAGIFVIDTKRLNGHITIRDDGISSGRTRYAGKSFRGSAVGLREALKESVGQCPWVQAVVAIWGEFPERLHVGDRVMYVSGEQLVEWLREQPRTLDRSKREKLARGVMALER